MRKLLAWGLLGLLGQAAWAVPVMPGDPNWVTRITDSGGVPGAGTGSGTYVVGPAVPPAGTGSFNFQPGDATQGVELKTTLFDGTLLSTIASLSYSTYATSFGGNQLPFLTLWIDLDGDLSFDDRIRYEPIYSTDAQLGSGGQAADVLTNTWQTWSLTATNARWYSDLLGGVPGGLFTLATYYGNNPLATIVDSGSDGGFRLASGYGLPGVYNANIDNLTFNGANFDFETGAPEIGSLQTAPVAMAMVMLVLGHSRRRKYQFQIG